jgi:ppGpp synthetase/RelA/SpoT-type nucleotidyltranferase
MIPQQLDHKMDGAGPFLIKLKEHVSNTLGSFADSRNYPFSGRIKGLRSIAEKIEMGRYRAFSEIDDLVAFTLIIPNAAHEDDVLTFCKSSFEVVAIRSKLNTKKAPDVFRFDATRVVARALRPPDLVSHKTPSIFDYIFEIQIRTAFEHAWVVATHDLVYKGSLVDWKRLRLAAQLKATSEGLDASIAAFDHVASGITGSPWDRLKEQIEVSKYVQSIFENERVPEVLKPDSISRFSDNFCALTRSFEPSLSVADAIKIVDDQLDKASPIPISLSLYQLFLGFLCQSGLVTDTKNIQCHVTLELMVLFPQTRNLSRIFDYNA